MGVSPLGGNNLYLLNIPQIREGGKSEHLLLENLYLINYRTNGKYLFHA